MLPLSNPVPNAALAGRIWRPDVGPCVVAIRGERVIDITSKTIPTMRDLCEADDPVALIHDADGEDIGSLSELTDQLLAPVDLQAIKACGVTFADSMVERVIEEQADGDPERANAIRARVSKIIGDSLSGVKPGS